MSHVSTPPAAAAEVYRSASATTPLPASSSLTEAHGLSGRPDYVVAVLECLTAEHGFSVGDKVFVSGHLEYAWSFGLQFMADETNVKAIFSAYVRHLDPTGAGNYSLTAANWSVRLEAWRFAP